MKSEKYYNDNIQTLDVSELRTFNRYFLHPKGKRACNQCRLVFSGIGENFHIKKHTKSGISWNVKCSACFNENNRARVAEYRKTPEKFIKSKVSAYRHRAKELDVPFDLVWSKLSELYAKQGGLCYYTAEPISFESITGNGAPHLQTPSLDRVEPELGYVLGNVVWCSYELNRMKNEMGYKKFLQTCEKILKNSKGVC